jgi:hypothetical protein
MKGVAGAPWIRISRRRPVIWPFSIVMITAVPKGRAWYGIPRANHGLRVSPGTFGARLWALFVGNRRCSVPFLYTWFFFVVRPTSTSRTCNRNGFPSGQSVTALSEIVATRPNLCFLFQKIKKIRKNRHSHIPFLYTIIHLYKSFNNHL